MKTEIFDMESDSSQENNPWCSLSTVNHFDKGASSQSTRCIDDSARSKSRKLMKKVSSSSMLIGSLINQLCNVLEKDPVQSKRLYLLLCDTMHSMKLIDPSYQQGGFELVQGRYMDAVYHLITVARATIGSDNSIPIPRPLVTYVSPYHSQFQEVSFIAAGGFGNVFKAIHKLDEVEYAIKKIIVRSEKKKNHYESFRRS